MIFQRGSVVLFLINTFLSLTIDRKIFLVVFYILLAIVVGGTITGMIYPDDTSKHKLFWFISGNLFSLFVLFCILYDVSRL